MACKERLETYLREKGVPHESQHHARAITAQEVAAAEHVPGRMFAKTVIVLPDDANLVMLVLPAPYHGVEPCGGRDDRLVTSGAGRATRRHHETHRRVDQRWGCPWHERGHQGRC